MMHGRKKSLVEAAGFSTLQCRWLFPRDPYNLRVILLLSSRPYLPTVPWSQQLEWRYTTGTLWTNHFASRTDNVSAIPVQDRMGIWVWPCRYREAQTAGPSHCTTEDCCVSVMQRTDVEIRPYVYNLSHGKLRPFNMSKLWLSISISQWVIRSFMCGMRVRIRMDCQMKCSIQKRVSITPSSFQML